MKILMVAAEHAPHAKTGGLADATAGLSQALSASGHDVRLLLPRYSHLPDTDTVVLQSDEHLAYRCLELAGSTGTAIVYLCDVPALAGVQGIYAEDERDALRFIALAEAAAALAHDADWRPDVIHCHDWHAGLVPITVRRKGSSVPTVLTLHNIGYQGVFPTSVLAQHRYLDIFELLPAECLAGKTFNFLRAGAATATALTTVSPTYAREIQTPEYGMGLETLIAARRDAVTGILNGADYSTWDPRTDPHIGHHYDSPCAPEKLKLKLDLCARLGVRTDATMPVVGLVSRLVEQKGIDLVVGAIPELIESTDVSFVMLGSGERPLERALRDLANQQSSRVSFTVGHNEALAHQIIAGSDLLVIPSRYEPCGLTQMYAMRFGTIPVVRRTGGLADTVEHFDPGRGTGNGAVFAHADVPALRWALRAAFSWFENTEIWRRLSTNAMHVDHSWHQRVPQYEAVFSEIVNRS